MPDTTPTTDRVRSAAQRALQSLDDLIADTADPGVEALGARHELATALFNTSPSPARLVLGTTDQPPAPAAVCTEHGAACHTREWPAPGAVTAAPADRAAVLREAASSVESSDVAYNTEAATAALTNGGPFALIAFVQLAIGAHLRRLADEAQPATDQPTETKEARLPWSDLLGAAPDITGGACTQCYMDRARDRDHDMSPEHARCRAVLDGPDTETEAAPLAVGDRYEYRAKARTVTVTRLWVDEYGADAVAFEWRGGMSGAAHSVDMFHQLYRPAP